LARRRGKVCSELRPKVNRRQGRKKNCIDAAEGDRERTRKSEYHDSQRESYGGQTSERGEAVKNEDSSSKSVNTYKECRNVILPTGIQTRRAKIDMECDLGTKVRKNQEDWNIAKE